LILVASFEEILSRFGAINGVQFPPISRVMSALLDEMTSGDLWRPLQQTLATWLLALALSFVGALVVGTVIGSSRVVRELTSPILEFLRPIPSTALIPLVILTLGVNIYGATFLTFVGTLWQILPMVVRAQSGVDPVSRDTALVYGFTPWQRFRWLTLPSMEPYLLTALRIGASAALILLVGMELLTGVAGIGREISLAYAGSNLPRMYAYILVSGLLGASINLVLARVIAARIATVKGIRT
jgi:ABC-type nitrate/sulfonate/bicarbonate transport system permease component